MREQIWAKTRVSKVGFFHQKTQRFRPERAIPDFRVQLMKPAGLKAIVSRPWSVVTGCPNSERAAPCNFS